MNSSDDESDVPPAVLRQRQYLNGTAVAEPKVDQKAQNNPKKVRVPRNTGIADASNTDIPLPHSPPNRVDDNPDDMKATFDGVEFNVTFNCRVRFNEPTGDSGSRTVMIVTAKTNPVRFIPKIGRHLKLTVAREAYTVVFDSSYYFDMGADNMLILTIVPTEDTTSPIPGRADGVPAGWRNSTPTDRLPVP